MWRTRLAVATVAILVALATPAHAQPGPPDESGVDPNAPIGDARGEDAFADPEVAELQRKAAEVQDELAVLQGEVVEAQGELEIARSRLDAATANRERADAVVEAQRSEVDRYVQRVFGTGMPNSLRALLTAPDPDAVLDGLELLSEVRRDNDERFDAALEQQRVARDAEEEAAEAAEEVGENEARLSEAQSDARDRAVGLSAELNSTLAATNAAVTELQERQRKRNEETAANWRRYTDGLAAAGIVLPPAASLRDPLRLPAGLTALGAPGGRPVAGVAQTTSSEGTRLLVLPAETIRAVTLAVSTLGLPYTPSSGAGSDGPLAYSCDGLVRAVFSQAGMPQPGVAGEQMAVGVPVAVEEIQPGDLVYLGPAEQGVQHVGIVLDGQTILASDARATAVGVTGFDRAQVVGASRPSLGTRPPEAVPVRSQQAQLRRCNGVQARAGQAAGAWGGFPNGLIPTAALCPIGIASHRLRCDAAQSFVAMSQAFAGVFGGPICITDSYRTFQEQIGLYGRKPGLAAVPGTSNHGWGLATDLCGGIERFGTPQHQWMLANAPGFGFVHPPWAAPGRGREEPWHWEFGG